MYSNHYEIIKYISFKLIHYIINLDAILSSKLFNEFDFVFSYNIFDPSKKRLVRENDTFVFKFHHFATCIIYKQRGVKFLFLQPQHQEPWVTHFPALLIPFFDS